MSRPHSWRSSSVQRRNVRPVTASRRTHDVISRATRSGRRAPDRTCRAVVRYTDNCEGVHVFGLPGKSSSGSADTASMLARYVGRVSARCLRSETSSSDWPRCGCAGEAKGEGRGVGSSPARLAEWRWLRYWGVGFVGLSDGVPGGGV